MTDPNNTENKETTLLDEQLKAHHKLYVVLKEFKGRGSQNKYKGFQVNTGDYLTGLQLIELGFKEDKMVRDQIIRPAGIEDAYKPTIILKAPEQPLPPEPKPQGKPEDDLIPINCFDINNRLYETVFKESKTCFAFLNDGEPHYVDQEGLFIPQRGEEIKVGMVILPSAVTPVDNVSALLAEIKAFINKYCDLPADFVQIATYYVLLTYFFDRLEQIPYLSFMGDTGTGKSRCKYAIGSLCYTPLLTSGGTTPAAFYRLISKWRGTLLIDEADFDKSDESQEIVKLLNCGYEKHSPRVVCDKDDPDKLLFFNAYCPKIISRRFDFSDKAVESRCITQITQQTLRKEILRVLPPCFAKEAEMIRNKLTWLRLKHWFDYDNPSENILADVDIEPRLQQAYTSLALVLAAFPDELRKFKKFLVKKNAELIGERSDTTEGMIVNTYSELLQGGEDHITSRKIRDKILLDYDNEVSQWLIAKKLKALGFRIERKKVSGIVLRVVKIPTETMTILIKRFKVGDEVTGGDDICTFSSKSVSLTENTSVAGGNRNTVIVTARHPSPFHTTNLTGIIPTVDIKDGEVTSKPTLTFNDKAATTIVPNVLLLTPEMVLAQISKTPRTFAEIHAPFAIVGVPEAETQNMINHLKGRGDIAEIRPDQIVRME